VVADEFQPRPSEGKEPLQRWRAGPKRRGTEQESLLQRPLVLVEQDEHESGPTAEPAEQCAFAHPRRGGDVVHRDGLWSSVGDEPPRSIKQQLAIARGVAALSCGLAGHRQRLVGGDHARL